jgi:hypothetical protein
MAVEKRQRRQRRLPVALVALQHPRQHSRHLRVFCITPQKGSIQRLRVVVDDAVGNVLRTSGGHQSAALAPDLLLLLRLEPQLAQNGIGYGAPQLVVVLSPPNARCALRPNAGESM